MSVHFSMTKFASTVDCMNDIVFYGLLTLIFLLFFKRFLFSLQLLLQAFVARAGGVSVQCVHVALNRSSSRSVSVPVLVSRDEVQFFNNISCLFIYVLNMVSEYESRIDNLPTYFNFQGCP